LTARIGKLIVASQNLFIKGYFGDQLLKTDLFSVESIYTFENHKYHNPQDRQEAG
jgi:hypothetical protein